MGKKKPARRIVHTTWLKVPIQEAIRDKEMMAEWKRHIEFDPLRDIEAWALKQAEPFVDAEGWKEESRRLGTDPDSLHPDMVRNHRLFYVARRLRRLDLADPEPITDLSLLMEQLAWGWRAHKTGDMPCLMQHLFWAGRIFERLVNWRPLEQLTEMGNRVAAGHKAAGERVQVQDDEKQRRSTEWQELVDKERRREPHISYTVATERVAATLTAKGHPVSGRTIRRYTEDVLPFVK